MHFKQIEYYLYKLLNTGKGNQKLHMNVLGEMLRSRINEPKTLLSETI